LRHKGNRRCLQSIFRIEVRGEFYIKCSVMQKLNVKWSTVFLILFIIPFLSPPLLLSTPTEANWLQGYMKSLKGGTIEYHSAQPDVTKALLVRSLNSEDFIEWETEPVPADYREKYTNFIWIFAMDVDAKPCNYDLYIDGKKYFRFSNPVTSSRKEWTIPGQNDAELKFRVSLVDRHGDVHGYASLRIPTESLEIGKAVTLQVAGETAGSRVWYMTFQSPVIAGTKIVPQQALIRRGDRLFQPVNVDIVHLGEPVKAKLTAQDQTAIEAELNFGFNRVEMRFPEVSKKKERIISIHKDDEDPQIEKFILSPVKKWFVYLVQHTHTDIGYTRPQSEILPEHLRFIDYALDFCDLTDDYPDDAKFRWTCEASWPVNQYLNSRPPSQIARLKKRINEGRIEITGMPFNMSEIADENIYAASLKPIKTFKDFELPVTTAMQNDVNGIAWCLADYFPGTGIEYLIMGEHGHRARIPFEMPTAFWWESPSGKRMLAFRADHYMTGNFWGIHTGNFQNLEAELLKYLEDLATRKYPHERIAVQYSGYYTDNAPPSTAGCEMIKRWNEKYEWPRLRSATANEFLAFIKEGQGVELPVLLVAWPDWWSDGFGSAALETAAARKTQAQLIANQGLLSMAELLGMSVPSSMMSKVDKIVDALLFWDEHTMGAAESIRDPLAENSVVQWAEKSAYVWEAAKEVHILQEAAMGLLQPFIPRAELPTIAVFNTLNWPRSGVAEVYIDHQMLPPGQAFRIVDEEGDEIFAQPSESRADGTTWHLQVDDIPAMGFKVYRMELLDNLLDQAKELDWENGDCVFENQYYQLTLDPKTGAIASLFDKQLAMEIADRESPWKIGQFIHETISNRSQLEQFHLVSCQREPLQNVVIQKRTYGPIWQSLQISGKTPTAETNSDLQCEIRLYHHEKRLEFHYSLIKKDIIEPEAIYIAFPFKFPDANVIFEAHGGMVSPGQNQLEGTSSDWNVVQNFLTVRNASGQIILGSEEVPLVQIGDLNLGKFRYIAEVEKPHVFSWVMNNYWVTNFKASQEGEFQWNYFLTSGPEPSNTFATRTGWGSRIPLLCRVFLPGEPEKMPRERSLLQIDADNILLVSTKPASTGEGIILHLRETAGKSTKFRIYSPNAPEKIWDIIEVNVLGEKTGLPIREIEMEALESRFFLLEF
jgi:alpha-mannosidase